MRTTIRLDEHLLQEAKMLAAEQGVSLTRIIEDALRERLKRRRRLPGNPVRLPTFGEQGVREGVDLDNSAELLRRMEERG